MRKVLSLHVISLVALLWVSVVPLTVSAQLARACVPTTTNQCQDCIDNDGDGRADYDGYLGGNTFVEPDPSCFTNSAKDGLGPKGEPVTEVKDDVVSSIIPCTDKCTFTSVFALLNNFLTFFIKTLLIPIFVAIIMYAGYKYMAAGANGGAKANVKKMLGNIVLGVVLILCSWLIVRTIMTTLLNDDFKQTGVEFLGN